MNKTAKIKKSASSKTLKICQQQLEDGFGVSAPETGSPRRDFNAQLQQIIDQYNVPREEIEQLVEESFKQGVNTGALRVLDRVIQGKIKTRKLRNEDSYELTTKMRKFDFTTVLPTGIKTKIKIKLKELGFSKD